MLQSDNNYQYLAIGGGMELKKENPITQAFVHLSGGKEGKITILPTASDYGSQIGSLYEETFGELCDDVKYYLIEKRSDAENPEILERLNQSTGIFFTGGDQLKITSLLGGSSVLKIIQEARLKGIFVAGTSAGASVMPDTMISWGPSDSILKGNLQMSPGISLVRNMIIDSHFVKRGRISRLFNLVAQNPGILGIGLAEDTGILIKSNNGTEKFKVIGSRQVIIVDGHDIFHSNISSVKAGQPFSLTNVKIHVLPSDYEFNCKTHEITIPKVIIENDEIVSEEVFDLPYKSSPTNDW
jgi:cyanophycinase